jgi:hypothetical protein
MLLVAILSHLDNFSSLTDGPMFRQERAKQFVAAQLRPVATGLFDKYREEFLCHFRKLKYRAGCNLI